MDGQNTQASETFRGDDVAERSRAAELAHGAVRYGRWPLAGVGVAAAFTAAAEFSEAVPQFDRPFVAGLAVAVGVAGAALVIDQDKIYRDHAETAVYPDDDMKLYANKILRRQRFGGLLGATMAAGALSFGLANAAQPYTEESRQIVTSVTAVIDVGAKEYTNDVIDNSTGENEMRVVVGANSILNANKFFQKGSTITFIAAGTEAIGMGKVDVSTREETIRDKDEIVTFAQTRLPFLKTEGDSALKDALETNDARNADKVVIVSSDVSKLPKSLFAGEAEPGADRISIISLGGSTPTPETTEKSPAADPNVSQSLVGKEDSYRANSSDEMTKIINTIAASQFTETEQHAFSGFEKLRNSAAALLLAGYSASLIALSMRRKYNRHTAIKVQGE